MVDDIKLRQKFNKYDIYIIIIIISLSTGVFGGALQLIRLISVLLLPYNLVYLSKLRFSRIYSKTFLIGIIWCIYGYFILQLSTRPSNGYFELLYIFLYFNLLLSIVCFAEKANQSLVSMAIGWSLCVGITLPFALYELITGNHFSTNSSQTELLELGKALNGVANKKYAAVFYNNYNEYVTFLSFSLPFIYYAFFIFRKLKLQIILFIEVLLVFFVMLLNASRGGIFCFVCTSIVFSLFYGKVRFPHKKLMLTIVLVTIILFFIKYSEFILGELIDRLSRGSMLEDKGRLMFYERGIQLLVESNYWGAGPSGYQIQNGYAPHNLWIEILSQYGIYVFGIIILVLFRVYKRIFISRTIESYLKYSIIVFLPFVSVINSGYLVYSFTWIYVASIVVILNNCCTKTLFRF